MPVLVTEKRNDLIKIPGSKISRIIIPNCVAHARYNYTLMQERILNYIMLYLQRYTLQVINGRAVLQLDIFKDKTNDIVIDVPLCEIAKATNYKEVKKNAMQLFGTVIAMPRSNEKGQYWHTYRSVFIEIDICEHIERSRDIKITISREVANVMLAIDTRKEGEKIIPYCYTNFNYEICKAAKTKYTSRIYKLISSYKERGWMKMTLDEIRDFLSLDPKTYIDYDSIKRRILMPAQEELKEKSDCWFNVADIELLKEGKKVVSLSFKIIKPTTQENDIIRRNAIINLLKNHCHFKPEHFDMVEHIIYNSKYHSELLYQLQTTYPTYFMDKSIEHPKMFVVKCIKNLANKI